MSIREHIIKISKLDDIFKTTKYCKEHDKQDKQNYENIKLYLDIDKTCMTPERIIATVFNSNNYVLRNRIIVNTKRISFNFTDSLVPTRYDLNKFINECKNKFNYIAYVTSTPLEQIDQIRKQLNDNSLPLDIDIVNLNSIKENITNNSSFYYIDSDERVFKDIITDNYDKSNAVLFQLSVF